MYFWVRLERILSAPRQLIVSTYFNIFLFICLSGLNINDLIINSTIQNNYALQFSRVVSERRNGTNSFSYALVNL